MGLPHIALSCSFETVPDARNVLTPRFVLSAAYIHALWAAGAHGVVLPHTPELTDAQAEQLLIRMDGLVVTGGPFDVPSDYYDQPPHPRLGPIDPVRSAFERVLMKAALRRGMPLLGICGGMQLLNVVQGGTLVQDLSLRPNTLAHEQPFDRARPSHDVRVDPHSRLWEALALSPTEAGALPVNSTHHQVLAELGDQLRACAWADDGVIEAIESPSGQPFVMGVQWHPEAMADERQRGIYRALVAAARKQQNH